MDRDTRTGLRGFVVLAMVAGMLGWFSPARAFPSVSDESNFVQFGLDACRLTAGTSLPIAGKFICPDSMYVSGNLGKSWNELDLVPHRLTTNLGNQSNATTDYKVSAAADGITNGKVGYDVVSVPEVNAAKSDASCTISAGAQSTQGTAAQPFGGGTDTVIYRDFTIHQNKNTTCVFDWYQRLALTSSQYSGSSLQSYIFPGANLSGSKKTLSIPTNEVKPQTLTKDMTASQTQDYVWNVTKSSNPTSLDFANTCAPDGKSANVAVTVSWTRTVASPSDITIITHVYATNPSARAITTTVTDRIYTGSTQATQVTPTKSASSLTNLTETVSIPAYQTVKVIDFTGTVPAGTATSFNDVATGSYIDTVSGVAIPQSTSAAAAATVSTSTGPNATATVSDSESISSGFHFKVNSTSGASGSFAGYTLGTSTTGPVVWTSSTQSGNGSVTFNKTVTADAAAYVTAADDKALSDTATLTGAGGYSATADLDVGLTSGATVSVGVHKNMQGGVTGTQTFAFDVKSGSTLVDTISIPITPPNLSGEGSIDVVATGTANTFTIHEQPSGNWAAQDDQEVTVTLPGCSGFATFNNTFGPATAKVQKVTVPAGNEAGWTFTLSGPGTPDGGENATTTDDGYVTFATALEQGDYVITETPQDGFDFTSVSGECSFSVVYPDDADRSFACTFTNTERGSLEVTKNVDWNGVTPDTGYTFELCITGPSYPNEPDCKTVDYDGGTVTWTHLLQGDYTVTETDPGTSWVVAGGDGATVTVNPGAKTTATSISNTRKLGSLQVTKSVDWNGIAPDTEKTFEICITGSSFPTTPDCKSADYDGATLTWSNLVPGEYVATETDPGDEWSVDGSPTAAIVVPTDGGTASVVPVITNTRKLGSLEVTKTVDWNGVEPIEGQTFTICITGPSFPNEPDCKTFTYADDLVQTWTGLIPGEYSITEPNLGASWTQSGDTSATVLTNGGTATAGVTNTRKLGSLQVTKSVDWNGIAPDTEKTFEICITGPSFPTTPDCKSADYDGATLTWSNLVPGEYVATETDPGDEWSVDGSPTAAIVVPTDGGTASVVPVITNTGKLGSLEVTKNVDWNGVTEDEGQSFEICITGPSFPNEPDCKSVGSSGGKATWHDLIPGVYTVAETDPGTSWTVTGDTSATVPTDGGTGTASLSNTRKLGSLQVTKTVDWNGVEPVDGQSFEICITGPSFPTTPDCKTFTYADDLVQTWTGLIPGAYAIAETDPGTSWTVTGDTSATVPADGGQATAGVTNTRKLGSLEVTKTVDWNGVEPVDGQSFEICITGPSFPTTPDCKTFTYDDDLVQTWTDLIPGAYSIAETDPGTSWTVTGDTSATVPADGGTATAGVTNTRKLGSLEVTKSVDWNGVTEDDDQSFEICITGPSFPSTPDCKSVGSSGGKATWHDLIPGVYSIAETDPGTSWTVTGDTSATVPIDGGTATAGVTNTRKLGSLQITKRVDWNGVEPVDGQSFEICITGPSFPTTPDCKTFIYDDDLVQTWTGLIPGAYAIAETDPGTSWIVTGDTSATVPADGGQATAGVTNTRKLGSLQVTKTVDWNGVEPVEGQTFTICITGPSFPDDADCKTFTYADDLVQTWTDLIPGEYTITEPYLGASWTQSGDTSATVPIDGGEATAGVTNTKKLGSLRVTKTVNWSGATPDANKTFEICISGPSYPDPDCKTVGSSGGDLTWSDLIPGDYSVTETDPGSTWTVSVEGSPATVPTNGGQATASVTNTLKKGHAKVVKTVSGAAPSGTQSFTFQLRSGASTSSEGTILESLVANAGNGGVITFTTDLTPGATYQLCEAGLLPGWNTSLGGFVPNSSGATFDNSVVCQNFTAEAGAATTFSVDNTPPPGGRAHTIGYWKNWASCTNSSTKKKPVLDQTLVKSEPTGIVVATGYLVLHSGDCAKAVALLNKSNFAGKKMASDPAFNLAAQLVAAQLNYVAGADQPAAATTAINQAIALLAKYKFTGNGYTGKISAVDAAAMNALAKTLDQYNNNLL